MDISAVISVLQVVVAQLPGAITTVAQLTDLGTKFYESVNGHAPSIEEVAALRAAIDADVATALTPLPPAQPGDPDYVKPVADPLDQPFTEAPPVVPKQDPPTT